MIYITTVFALVFVAVCSGQSSTTWVPKSDCGIQALQCYNNQKETMNDKFDATNFASACLIYKSIITCMASIGDCGTDLDYLTVRQEVDGDQDGICGVDGSLQTCGYDVQKCFSEMDAVLGDALIKQFNSTCPLIAKFANCSKYAINQKDCPTDLVTRLQQIQQNLQGDTSAFGCNGPCEQAIAFCTESAEALPTDANIANFNLLTYCQSAVKVYSCLNNLTTSAHCTSAPQGFLIDVAQNELASIGDLCKVDGSPSDCVTSLSNCAADLSLLKKGDSTSKVCKVSSEFLECASHLPCVSALAPMIAKFRNTIETVEIEATCPSVGSCNDRWHTCAQMDEGLINMTKANKPIDCKLASKGSACFKYVSNDPICISEKNTYLTQKQDIDMLYNLQCGSEGTAIFVQLPLLVAALLASLKQYF